MRKLSIVLLFGLVSVLSIFLSPAFAESKDLKVSLAYLPGILESPEKGVFIEMIKAIDEVYEGNIDMAVYPVARSMENVVNGKADFHMPMIRNTLPSASSLPYTFTSEKMGDVYFVIYSHKENPITYDMLQQAKNKKPFPYKIETQGMGSYFDFPIADSVGVENSLKKVNIKRIDAFIFAQEECDFTTKQLRLKNIHREIYNKFDDVFVIPKGDKGKEIDRILSACLVKLRSDGRLKDLHKKIHIPFQEWQPHEMGW